ncbi:MAG: hypothetical protein N3E37_05030 [Candidatus Micrarchaeota archaeon]|nr:hypothetical protein [Candidatus Micrarchaeota archaeon]
MKEDFADVVEFIRISKTEPIEKLFEIVKSENNHPKRIALSKILFYSVLFRIEEVKHYVDELTERDREEIIIYSGMAVMSPATIELICLYPLEKDVKFLVGSAVYNWEIIHKWLFDLHASVNN